MLMEEEDLQHTPYMFLDCLALQAAEKSLYDLIGENYPTNPPDSRVRKNDNRGDEDDHDEVLQSNRNNKQPATSSDDHEELNQEMYDKLLLCPHVEFNSILPLDSCCPGSKQNPKENPRSKKQTDSRRRRQPPQELVDLQSLLNLCAQHVAGNDNLAANDLLHRIRQHSSPYGDSFKRVSHYLANGLQARLTGTGNSSYTILANTRISAAQILRGYQASSTASPFKQMSNFFANRSIGKLAMNADRIHIIDFGILYGFQWPCLIQRLACRPGGPPMLRITGIEFPQPGLKPTQRVEETGRRLKNYCERFRVPFEYSTIASKWEVIKLYDLKLNSEEFLVVNCLYRLRNVPDETVIQSSPRDRVLKLIKQINPDLFIHGVVNGSYNAPFFLTRFKEAVYYFSSVFDMFDATLEREDEDRLLFEQEVYGREIMNVVACEGMERVDRPETIKQWQGRNQRAGFRQMELNKELVREVRKKVKMNYNKDFSVDEDGGWILQGWKGRVLYAISCWKVGGDI
ncbi:scarecrow-like protein 33 isoform X2 [Impatiens glandulifera]|nr:scarecrow-like protein 33 isoform X2 [Impatiens glandulifera]